MAHSRHLVVGLGEALWDILPSGRHLGGAPLNFAYISSLLGKHAAICTRVGDDALGKEIKHELAARRLDTNGVQIDSDLPTGTVKVRLKDSQPEYEIRQPAAWDALECTPQWLEIVAKSDAICFGSLAQRSAKSRETVLKMLENASKSCLKVLDINLRKPFYSRQVIESALQFANILKLNDAELAEIAAMFGIRGNDQRDQMRALLREFALKCVFVTCGEHGAVAVNDENETAEHLGFTVEVRDTIGAGDAFTAAAVHALLAGMDLKSTLALANRWASWVASQPGGMPNMNEKAREMLIKNA
jgi:fructokinase